MNSQPLCTRIVEYARSPCPAEKVATTAPNVIHQKLPSAVSANTSLEGFIVGALCVPMVGT